MRGDRPIRSGRVILEWSSVAVENMGLDRRRALSFAARYYVRHATNPVTAKAGLIINCR